MINLPSYNAKQREKNAFGFQKEVVSNLQKATSNVIGLNEELLHEKANPSIISLTIDKLNRELNKPNNISPFNTKQNELLRAVIVIVESNKYIILEKGNLTNGDIIKLLQQVHIIADHNNYAAA